MPDYPVTQAVLRLWGRLLAVTSANRSGESAALRAEPESTIEPLTASAVTWESALVRRRISLSGATSGSTRISTLAIWRPAASKKKMLV